MKKQKVSSSPIMKLLKENGFVKKTYVKMYIPNKEKIVLMPKNNGDFIYSKGNGKDYFYLDIQNWDKKDDIIKTLQDNGVEVENDVHNILKVYYKK